MTENSAEREAEQILQEAARKIQTEECPQGEECAVHHRVDDAYQDEKSQYARYITYFGDYVVITEDNPELESPLFLLKAILGQVTKETLPPRWETSIFHVGSGPLGDLSEKPLEDRIAALRYIEKHDDWSAVKGVHDSVVVGLQGGLIDVSRPVKEG